MSYETEISRIVNARNKIRDKAVALGLKKWANMYSDPIEPNTEIYTSTQGIENYEYRVRLVFETESDRDSFYSSDYIYINNTSGDVVYVICQDADFCSRDPFVKVDSLELHMYFPGHTSLDEICIKRSGETSCNLTAYLDEQTAVTDTDKLDAVADAIENMEVPTVQVIDELDIDVTGGAYEGIANGESLGNYAGSVGDGINGAVQINKINLLNIPSSGITFTNDYQFDCPFSAGSNYSYEYTSTQSTAHRLHRIVLEFDTEDESIEMENDDNWFIIVGDETDSEVMRFYTKHFYRESNKLIVIFPYVEATEIGISVQCEDASYTPNSAVTVYLDTMSV